MTGFTQDLERLNQWMQSNYTMLSKYCHKYRIEEDYISKAYILTHDRIIRSGFTENYFNTYIKRVISNLIINDEKKAKGKHFIDCDDHDFHHAIENALIEADEIDKDDQAYREEVLYFSKKIFEYIYKYDQEYQFVFRSYYLMPSRFTYKKLTAMTGINKNKCTRIIQTMKQDIRCNFITWLKDGEIRSN